jgi:virginiamycin B lyase
MGSATVVRATSRSTRSRFVLCAVAVAVLVGGCRSAFGGPPQNGSVSDFRGPTIVTPTAITKGPDGDLWFTDPGNSTIGRMTTNGTRWAYRDPQLATPGAIAVGSDNALWFTNQSTNSIGRITTSGAVSHYAATNINGPIGIAAGPDGALWFTNFSGNSIGRITTSGAISVFTDSSISGPRQITTGPDGALWFTNFSGNSIGRITTSGVVTSYADATIGAPTAIASFAGALWFANSQAALTGPPLGRIATNGTVSQYDDYHVDVLTSLTTGPDNTLWFTDGDFIGHVTAQGTFSNYADPGIDQPTSITTGSDGALWFTNRASIGRMTDQDPAAPAGPPKVSAGDCDVYEGQNCVFTLSLSSPSTARVTVRYSTDPGVFGASDFKPISGTVTFPPGVTTESVTVVTVADDVSDGGRFNLLLLDAVGADLGRDGLGSIGDGTEVNTIALPTALANQVNRAWEYFGSDPVGPIHFAARLTRLIDAETPGGLGVVSLTPMKNISVFYDVDFNFPEFNTLESLAKRLGLNMPSFEVYSAQVLVKAWLAQTSTPLTGGNR